jgi:hypothetical protein
MNAIPIMKGSVVIKSNLEIEELGRIISNALFSNCTFVGRDKNIYDEVPAIFIDRGLLGLNITLSGNKGITDEYGYSLEVMPKNIPENIEIEKINISSYLSLLLKQIESDDIIILNN